MDRIQFLAKAMIALRSQPMPFTETRGSEREGYQQVTVWYERTPDECLTEAKRLWRVYRDTKSANDD